MKAKRLAGFTVVELLIVIVVIAILATITIVSYNGVQKRAAQVKYASDVSAILQKVEMYKTIIGTYPNTAWWTTTINFSSTDSSTTLPGNLRAYPIGPSDVAGLAYSDIESAAKGTGVGAPYITYATVTCTGGALNGFMVVYPDPTTSTVQTKYTGTC